MDRLKFIEKAKLIHGDKYDYSKVKYVNNKIKVCIICPEHGEFWQMPSKHINSKQGCPICNESKLEHDVSIFLDANNIKYERQKKFKWLGLQSLDFYLPDYNTAIECQGRQHFIAVKHFGGDYGLKQTINRDIMKKELCNKYNIKLLYFLSEKYNNSCVCNIELLYKKIIQ